MAAANFKWKAAVTKTLTDKMLGASEKRFDLGTLYINVPVSQLQRNIPVIMRVRGGPDFTGVVVKLQTSGATHRWFATFADLADYKKFCAQLRVGMIVTFVSLKEGRDIVIEVSVAGQHGPAAAAPVPVPAPVPAPITAAELEAAMEGATAEIAPVTRVSKRRRSTARVAEEGEADDTQPAPRPAHRGKRSRGSGKSKRGDHDEEEEDYKADLEDHYVARTQQERYAKQQRRALTDVHQVSYVEFSDFIDAVYDLERLNNGADMILRIASIVEGTDDPEAVAAAEAEAEAAVHLAGAADLFLAFAEAINNEEPPVPAAAPAAPAPNPRRSAARRGKGGATAAKATASKKIAKKQPKKQAKKPAPKDEEASVPCRRSLRGQRLSDEEPEAADECAEVESMDEDKEEEDTYVEKIKELAQRSIAAAEAAPRPRTRAAKRLSDQDAPAPVDATEALLGSPRAAPAHAAAVHKTAGGVKKKTSRGSRGGAAKQAKKAKDASDVEDMDME